MKKVISLLLVLCMILSLSACGKKESNEAEDYGDNDVITVPASYIGEGVTQESLDASAGASYISAKLNSDGSVTYVMTGEQHKNMLDGMASSMDALMQSMIDDDKYTFTEIKHNDDFSQFDVTVSGDDLEYTDSLTAVTFYMYGGMYGIFSGKQAEKIVVNFYNANGELISTADSSKTGN